MPKKISRAANDKLLLALACGATTEGAARQVGICERTVRRRLNDPHFARQLQTLRGEMLQRTADQLTAAGTEAVRTLLLLQQTPNSGTVRLGAARAVLEIGIKIREIAEFEARLVALEAADAERRAQETSNGSSGW
jgi:hypothetical protein